MADGPPSVGAGEEKMIKIAIVEDDVNDAAVLEKFLGDYAESSGEMFNITKFANGMQFITEYRGGYDIVFMDIEMPTLNGLDSARKLREVDSAVIIIFVTNLARYAINGYEVSALDYVLKPIKYPSFSLKIKKAVEQCKKRSAGRISIRTRNGVNSFPADSIIYVESRGHNITYHTERGDFPMYGTMKEVEGSLPEPRFFRCNSYYIVNLSFVTGCVKNEVQLANGETIAVSRARKKQMLEALQSFFISGGGGSNK